MQYDQNKSFPHPVLSDYNDDYAKKSFQADPVPEWDADNGELTLDVTFQLSEPSLKELIAEGKAKYCLLVKCPTTFYRQVFLDRDDFTKTIKNGELQGKVELQAYIVCTKPVKGYTSAHLNAEYDGARYNLSPGTVLALIEPTVFYLDQSPFEKLGTVFEIVEDADIQESQVAFDDEGEKVKIRMSPDDKNRFEQARAIKEKKPYLLMCVYLPVIMELLKTMASEERRIHEDKRWYRAIESKLAEKNISLSPNMDILKAAQELLHWPLATLPLD